MVKRSLLIRSSLSGLATIVKWMLKQRAELDSVLHALADPGRRAIVERLSGGPASVSELAGPMSISLSAVVQHLQVLETSGLIESEKVGRVRTCRLRPASLSPVERWIRDRRSTWERRLDRLGDYLNEGRWTTDVCSTRGSWSSASTRPPPGAPSRPGRMPRRSGDGSPASTMSTSSTSGSV